jgi:hypothetical protein
VEWAQARHAILSRDTASDIETKQIELWRRMSPLEKIRLASEMSVAAKTLAEAGIRQRFPCLSQRERFLHLAILTLGPDLARLVYPDAAPLLSSQ